MYYLQSRYYDAKICRFINAYSYVSTGQGLIGYNMFAYCGNNPVNRVDPNGEGWIGVIVLVVVLALTLTSCSQQTTEDQIDQAKAAADNAKMEKSANGSIDTYIDLSDELNHFDNAAYDEYIDQLYANMVATAKLEEVPTEKLMSREHIAWEYNIHKFFYNTPIEAFKEPCKEAHLNVEETWGTLIQRGWGYLIDD